MKVMCKMSIYPIRIHNNTLQWVYCPTLVRKKIQKTSVDICKECRFFIDIINTLPELRKGNHTSNHSISIRPVFKRGVEELKYVESKDVVPLTDVFAEGDKVRILTEMGGTRPCPEDQRYMSSKQRIWVEYILKCERQGTEPMPYNIYFEG